MIYKFWDSSYELPKVKICDIKNLESAMNIADLGADALGFQIKKDSNVKDNITNYRTIIESVRYYSRISCWILTDVYDIDLLKKILDRTNADTVQLQGKIDNTELQKISQSLTNERNAGLKLVKTISLNEGALESNIEMAFNYAKHVDALLVDSKWKRGGSGISYNYELSNKLKEKNIRVPIILAGGLTPENIFDTIKKTNPFGVDVQSGVEDVILVDSQKPVRYKNFSKCDLFIKTAKNASLYDHNL